MNESFAFHGYSTNNQFMCVINGDDIYQIDYMTGNQKVIGKTEVAYKELEQTTTEYYNKLVELGVIVPPKDPQAAMEEMQQAMANMANLIKDLSEEVKELRQSGSEYNNGNGEQNVPKRESQRRSGKSSGSNSGDT